MNELNFDNMTRDELAHYMVAHRDTPEAVEARRDLIRQMAKRAESRDTALPAVMRYTFLFATLSVTNFQRLDCTS
jgi:hypothetical protein